MGASTSRVPLPDASIPWYRTKLDPALSARLHTLSDAKAWRQCGGFALTLLGSLAAAVRFASLGNAPLALAFSLLYGLQANFLINAMHELGHGQVFATRALNHAFLRLFSFLGWLHPDMFFSSHLRHHRFTQNPPHDLENPTPIRVTLGAFLRFGFVNVWGAGEAVAQTVRAAAGVYPTGHLGWLPGWEETCYPPEAEGARAPAMLWARAMLAGHVALALASVALGWPLLLPALVSGGPFFNGWLFFLCNSTQHVGLPAGAADFRANTRTFELHPLVRFLYWQMNFHIEHHMYAMVPCYHLAELHAAIKHDLPPTPNGIAAVWRDVAAAMAREEREGAAKKAA